MQQLLGLCPAPPFGDVMDPSAVLAGEKSGLEMEGLDGAIFGDWLLDFETGHEESMVGAGA